ncbi:MAG: prolyl oligopeptidase family serine peptidase [Ignavibacteria bacterium]|nr:prolyl oligopeptidase family serine peptidase [Ignavibacteria bacterium]
MRNFTTKFISAFPLILISILLNHSYPQELTLEYIFQEPEIINPRPSLKTINTKFSKIYYYADDDFDGKLNLFDYNYLNGEYFRYENTGNEPSEFLVLPEGDAVCVFDGEIYISKSFTESRAFSKDIKLTETEEHEYSPQNIDSNIVLFRRKGNYYLLRFNEKGLIKEIKLTGDESDTVSYQLSAYHSDVNTVKIFLIRYNNSPKREFIFPDYTDEFVKLRKGKRGFSYISFYELIISGDSVRKVNLFYFPDSLIYSAHSVTYSPDGSMVIIDADSKARNLRKIFRYQSLTADMKEIYSEVYEKWYERHANTVQFIDNSSFIFESEIDGYNGLYKINTDGNNLKRITPTGCTVRESIISTRTEKIYFVANAETPQNYYLYETDFSGNGFKKIFDSTGSVSNIKISDDGEKIFFSYSYVTQPPEIYMTDKESNLSLRITYTVSPYFSSVQWVKPELITFRNREDNELIYAYLYKPKDFNERNKYPLICFAHGAGYLQNVTSAFSPYQDNFMFNTFLTLKGFVILDIDFRGSAGYGAEFRNKTYKNLGYWEISDYISGIGYLDSLGIIDKTKVGIYGGSYGGFITLMAVFQRPDVFSCGVSLRAVTNWKNYYYSNPWYTMARLGEYNDENKFYYEISSPVTYAENLSVPLLITHGMLDDNVFFQDMVQLTQKLIDNEKEFEIMFHPRESHSYYRQSSWLDLYKRVWKFFERNLK